MEPMNSDCRGSQLCSRDVRFQEWSLQVQLHEWNCSRMSGTRKAPIAPVVAANGIGLSLRQVEASIFSYLAHRMVAITTLRHDPPVFDTWRHWAVCQTRYKTLRRSTAAQ